MKKIYILEVWHSGPHTAAMLYPVGAFSDMPNLEKYKLLNPPKTWINEFYSVTTLNLLG